MPSTWEKRVRAARRELDKANQETAQARHALHATANAAYKAGMRPTDIAGWAQVTLQALHQWRRKEQK